jgi:hypothetical protein
MIYILIALVWVMYGAIAAIQDKTTEDSTQDVIIFKWCVMIVLAPAIFVGKCLYGAFKEYH